MGILSNVQATKINFIFIVVSFKIFEKVQKESIPSPEIVNCSGV